jgi:hypothetical protein
MAGSKVARVYLGGFGTARSVLDLDNLTLTEILVALDRDRYSGPYLTAWKQAYLAAIRSALGH